MSDSPVSTQHEYYIRQPSENEARGPFSLAQLRALAASGGLNTRTLYYNAALEQWLSITDSPDLSALIPAAAAGARAHTSAPHAAAPAHTDNLAPRLVTAMLAAGAIAFLLPLLLAPVPGAGGGLRAFLAHPFAWLGALDALLVFPAGFLAAKFFPIVRLRAALGFGFLCLLFWLQERPALMLAAAIASVCLWLATVFPGKNARVVNAIAGLAALATLAYSLLP